MIERAAKRGGIGIALLRAAGSRAARLRGAGNHATVIPPVGKPVSKPVSESDRDPADEKPAGNPQAGRKAEKEDEGAGPAGSAADVPRWLRVSAAWS